MQELKRLRQHLTENELKFREDPEADHKLKELRLMYEPYAQAMAQTLAIDLPPWIHQQPKKDNWQAGPWDRLVQAQSLENIGHKVTDDF